MGHLTPAADRSAGFIGIVCGLQAEAACIERALRRAPERLRRVPAGHPLPSAGHPWAAAGVSVRVGVSGARPAEAERIAARFAAEGARLLLSFGIAGALDPTLAAGDIVIASRIDDAGRSHPCIGLALPSRPSWREGPVHGSDRLIGDPAEKALLATGGALAVDMESHRVARIACGAGIPVAAIRAISDSSVQSVPAFVAGAVRADGTPRFAPVLAGLARDPRTLGDLIALRRGTNAALGGLGAAAADVLEACATSA